jgi:hypothetical protein
MLATRSGLLSFEAVFSDARAKCHEESAESFPPPVLKASSNSLELSKFLTGP